MSHKSCQCDDEPATMAPTSVVNSAGVNALSCRIGAHGSLLEALKRRLSSRDYPQLASLRARATSDPSLALLDAWSAAGDVLTFYNERCINEGFLRTATELRSLTELSRLIGYRPGPGVASSVFLAFTLEKDPKKEISAGTLIPKGTAVKSVPGDGELPQTFETAEDLIGRMEWNAIKPRQTRPQDITSTTIDQIDQVTFAGRSTRLAANDVVLFAFENKRVLRRVLRVATDDNSDVTRVDLTPTKFSAKEFLAAQLAVCGTFGAVLRSKPTHAFAQVMDAQLRLFVSALYPENGLIALDKSFFNETPQWTPYETSLIHAGSTLESIANVWDTTPFVTNTTNSTKNLVKAFLATQTELQIVVDILHHAWRPTIGTGISGNVAIPTMKKLVTDAIGAPNTAGTIQDSIKGWTGILRDTGNSLVTALESLAAAPDPATRNRFRDAFIRIWASFTDLGLETQVEGLSNSFGLAQSETLAKTSLQEIDETINSGPAFVPLGDSIRNAVAGPSGWLFLLGNSSPNELRVRYTYGTSTTRTIPNADSPTPVQAQGLFSRLADANPAGPTIASTFADADSALGSLITSVKTATAILPAYDPVPGFVPLRDDVRLLGEAIHTLDPIDSSAADFDSMHRRFGGLRTAINDTKDAVVDWRNGISTNLEGPQKGFIEDANTAVNLFENPEIWERGNTIADKAWRLLQAFLTHIAVSSTLEDKVALPSSGTTPKTLEQVLKELREDLVPSPGGAYALRYRDLEGRLQLLLEQVSSFKLIVDDEPTVIDVPGVAGLAKAVGGLGPTSLNVGALNRDLSELLKDLNDDSGEIPDLLRQVAGAASPHKQADLIAIWRQIKTDLPVPEVFACKKGMPIFGFNAPTTPVAPTPGKPVTSVERMWSELDDDHWKRKNEVFLSQPVEGLAAGSTIVFQRQGTRDCDCQVDRVISPVQRSAWGLNSTACHVFLSTHHSWHGETIPPNGESDITFLRNTLALIASDKLELSEVPISKAVGAPLPSPANARKESNSKKAGDTQREIELDNLYLDLEPGRYVVFEGERDDLPGAHGRDIARIKYVRHVLMSVPNDHVHTRLVLDRDLNFKYKRDKLIIYANVVRATHGETTRQVLGSGDASLPFQTFALAKGPVTYLAAATPSGVESTLAIRVDNLLWHEKEALLDSTPIDRDYVVDADEYFRSSARFGDGTTGARLPTGRENVRAEYRVGLGKSGNVKAGRITQLAHRPLGVKDVTNPLPATGGADPEVASQIRVNAPLAVMALDRLVSTRDYAAFARNYAAIDKADAARLFVGGQATVGVTIAGADDIPIALDSDVIINLRKSYEDFGDPIQAVHIEVRELLLIFLGAKVRLKPDYEWRSVEPAIRDALYDYFSFARRDLGQDAYLSEAESVIQRVEGVLYVDIDIFSELPESSFRKSLEHSAKPLESRAKSGRGDDELSLPKLFQNLSESKPKPVINVKTTRHETDETGAPKFAKAQIAYLSRDVPDSLFLQEITS